MNALMELRKRLREGKVSSREAARGLLQLYGSEIEDSELEGLLLSVVSPSDLAWVAAEQNAWAAEEEAVLLEELNQMRSETGESQSAEDFDEVEVTISGSDIKRGLKGNEK